MSTRDINLNESTAALRRVYFFCVDATDGQTPETGEDTGQPEISTNGGAFTSTGIGTLNTLGDGWYYAELTQAAVNGSIRDAIQPRYKSANTLEAFGTFVTVVAATPDVNVASITAGAIAAASFAANAITSTVVADNFITAAKLASNVLTSAKFATDALTSGAAATSFLNAIRDAILSDATRFKGGDVDRKLSVVESNIRGVDGDDLKDLSDEIATRAAPSDVQVWESAPA